MGQALLTSNQATVLGLVGDEPKLASFYLSGGTALAAFHLRHRVSDDLDFFSMEAPDPIFLHGFCEEVRKTLGGDSVFYERLYDRHLFQFAGPNGILKVEFTRYPFRCFEVPSLIENVRVDGFRDIAANKLMAMLDRFDPKDFADLYFIFQRRTLAEVRSDVEGKFNVKIDPVVLGGELAKVRRVETLPKMTVPLSLTDLKVFFTALARQLAPSVLM